MSAYSELDLSTAALLFGSIYSGGRIGSAGWSDFTFSSLTLDPASTYQIQVDIENEGIDPGVFLFGFPASEDAETGATPWSYLGGKGDGALALDATTLTTFIGPGMEEWGNLLGVDAGLVFDLAPDTYVTGARYRPIVPVAGSWQDDAGPVWIQTAFGESGSGGSSSPNLSGTTVGANYAGWDQEPDMASLWSCIGTVYHYPTEAAPSRLWVRYNTQDGSGDPYTVTEWDQAWLTVSRTTDATATEGILPDTVVDVDGNFIDPNVLSVEWEPSTAVLAQRLNVALAGDAVASNPPGLQVHVKFEGSGSPSSPYDPGTQTAAYYGALADAAVFTGTDSGVVIPDPSVPTYGATSFALSLVDDLTNSQTWSSFLGSPHETSLLNIVLTFTASLEAEFKPRYRLLYAVGGPKPLRQSPRNDGLAGSARRLYPASRSYQRSNRRAGGYL